MYSLTLLYMHVMYSGCSHLQALLFLLPHSATPSLQFPPRFRLKTFFDIPFSSFSQHLIKHSILEKKIYSNLFINKLKKKQSI